MDDRPNATVIGYNGSPGPLDVYHVGQHVATPEALAALLSDLSQEAAA